MDTYPRASIVNRSGKKGWYVCVTVPPELRSLFPSKQIYKKIKGAETKQDAWDTYKKYEAEIWIEFDRANLANHPLCKAYDALREATEWIKSNRSDYYLVPEGEDWEPPEALDFEYEHLFDNELRWQWYDIVRNKAGFVLAYPNPGMADPETAMSIAQESDKIEPLLEEFDLQFRKVSQENFAPKKRGKLFSEVAEEYHQSSLFLRNKKTNALKRKRTTNKEKRAVERFLRWVNPAITVDEFGHKLATSYMEALADPTSGLIEKHHGNAPSNETIADSISAIKNVLNWAVRNEYIISSPWADVTVAGYGEAKKSYRDWSEDELRQVFSLDMPPQDFL